MRQILFLLVLFFITPRTFGQEDDRINTVYVNITHPLLFGHAYIVGYERVLRKDRSFTINFGNISLPKFGDEENDDSVKLTGNSGNKGIHVGVDYRFYLSKQNKFQAPRGVYLAPFYSYNYSSRTNQWDLNSSTFNGVVTTGLSFNVHTVGLQIGYQFVFWKRMAVDLVMCGPGVGFYKLEAAVHTNLSPDQESLLFEKLNAYLEDKIPGYSLIIKEGDFRKDGSANTTTWGFRYMVNVGYRF